MEQFADTPVCLGHAMRISRTYNAAIEEALRLEPLSPIDRPKPFVYYLMVAPSTVKIGTTTNLPQRLSQLRTDLQYVVALELGGRDVERDRHLQFARERIGRREDFALSGALKMHIESLQPRRDELATLATSRPQAGKPLAS